MSDTEVPLELEYRTDRWRFVMRVSLDQVPPFVDVYNHPGLVRAAWFSVQLGGAHCVKGLLEYAGRVKGSSVVFDLRPGRAQARQADRGSFPQWLSGLVRESAKYGVPFVTMWTPVAGEVIIPL